MKLFKKLLVLTTMMAVLFSMTVMPVSAAAKPSVTVDGTVMSVAASYGAPFIDSASRLQVPIRAISEKLGATVAWDAATSTATINGSIKIKVGAKSITTAYGTVAMDTSAVVKDGRIYVPLRYIGNALGYQITSSTKNGAIVADIVTKVDLTVSAAASLKDAMTDIKALYLAEKPNTALTINLAASGTLEKQIEEGAPVDVFLSASTSNMTALKDAKLMEDSSIKNLLKNTIVLVVPTDSKSTITSFADVTDSSIKKIALGEPTTVPAGQYAEQVFTYLGILDKVKAKAVYGTDVKQVLNWVETGNADAGVVYSTDAKVSTGVKVIATASEDSHKAIVYPAGVVKATKNSVAANDFVNFLSSDAAKAVFEKYGFSVL